MERKPTHYQHAKEMNSLFEKSQLQNSKKYEEVIDRLACQNRKLKKESVRLA
jgi:hypothetical protein